MNCPPIADRFIFADDAKLAAQLSRKLIVLGAYLPVCDEPRMQRPDSEYEVLRRHDVLGRSRAKIAYVAGLSDAAYNALSRSLNSRRTLPCPRISSAENIASIVPQRISREVLWGRDRIGVGLLKALRARQDIVFEDRPSPLNGSLPNPGIWSSAKKAKEISEMIAANYA